MRNLAPLWLHRASNIAVLPTMIGIAIIFGALIGSITAVAEVVKGFRKHWGDDA